MSSPFLKNLMSVPGFAWKFLMNVQVPTPRVMAEAGGVPVVGESGVRGLVWSAQETAARGMTIRTRVRTIVLEDLRIEGASSLHGFRPSRAGLLPGTCPR